MPPADVLAYFQTDADTGGRSVRTILDRIKKNAGELTELVNALNKQS